MDAGVVAALITAAVSIILAIYSSWTTRKSQIKVEYLRSELTDLQAERDAQRDYEYEARKKLYQQCEPLIFQLIEASENALSHIRSIATRVKAPDGTVFSDEYYLKTTMYYLLLPCAVLKMITKRLTFVDLQVDGMIYTQYIFAKAVYLSFTDDFHFAKLAPELDYNPYVDHWREKREQNPQVYRRQGFALGRLDNALDTLIIDEERISYHFMSFGEFEKEFDKIQEGDVKSSLGTVKDLFFEFHPHTRPVLWRILITQALLYRCILELSLKRNMTLHQIMEFLTTISREEMSHFDWRLPEQKIDDNIIFEPFEVAKTYLNSSLKRRLELLETISRRKANTEATRNRKL